MWRRWGMNSDNGRALLWANVTANRPCPICTRPDWCAVSEDGDWCCCRRLDRHTVFGNGRAGIDSAGADYWTYRLRPRRDDGTWPEPRYTLAGGGGERADPDILHRVYSHLSGCLPLYDRHR